MVQDWSNEEHDWRKENYALQQNEHPGQTGKQEGDILNVVSKKVLDAFFRKNTVYKVLVDQESLTTFPPFLQL